MLKKAVCVFAACVVGLGLFCGCGDTPQGTFYTLQEAYDSGYLTREDLISIAYYNNGGREGNEEIMAEDYAPISKNPEVLSEETEQAIKQTAAYDFRNDESSPIPDASAEGFEVIKYYGSYNGYFVVIISDSYFYAPAVIVPVIGVEIDGVYIHTNPDTIKVWKSN